jgi:hypothetical protein
MEMTIYENIVKNYNTGYNNKLENSNHLFKMMCEQPKNKATNYHCEQLQTFLTSCSENPKNELFPPNYEIHIKYLSKEIEKEMLMSYNISCFKHQQEANLHTLNLDK